MSRDRDDRREFNPLAVNDPDSLAAAIQQSSGTNSPRNGKMMPPGPAGAMQPYNVYVMPHEQAMTPDKPKVPQLFVPIVSWWKVHRLHIDHDWVFFWRFVSVIEALVQRPVKSFKNLGVMTGVVAGGTIFLIGLFVVGAWFFGSKNPGGNLRNTDVEPQQENFDYDYNLPQF